MAGEANGMVNVVTDGLMWIGKYICDKEDFFDDQRGIY